MSQEIPWDEWPEDAAVEFSDGTALSNEDVQRQGTIDGSLRPSRRGKSRVIEGLEHIKDERIRQRVARKIRNSQRQKVMRRVHDESCPVCESPKRLEMEALFKEWVPVDEIAAAYELDKSETLAHFTFTGMFRQRDGNRGGVYRQIVRRGMADVAKGGKHGPKIAVKDIIKANDSLVMMEGGFKASIDMTTKLEMVGRTFGALTPQQLTDQFNQIIQALSNPGSFQPVEVVDIKAIPASDSGSKNGGQE